MTQSRELAVRDDMSITPQQFGQELEYAAAKAKALSDLVEKQRLFVQIGTSKYLRVEAWETIGKGYGYSASSRIAQIIRDEKGAVAGVVAHADVLTTDGIIIGGADSTCFADEEGKVDMTVSQLAGMAQTRAVSRALKQLLSWVVVLAGYDATPAEEMHGRLREQKESEANEYGICEKHNVAFFQSAKMRSPAHKNEDGSWCNKPKEDKLTEAFGPSRAEENPTTGAKASKANATAPKQASSGAPVNPLKAEVIALAAQLGVKEAGVPTWVRAHIQDLCETVPPWTQDQLTQIRDAMKTEVNELATS